MNTNIETLCKYLKNYSPYALCEEQSLFYDGFCLYSDASESRKEKLIYIAKYSSIIRRLSLPSAVCYICINDTQKEITEPPIPIVPFIILNTDASVSEIFNLLLEAFFQRYRREEAFKENLLDLLASGANITTILQEATKEYQNPFIVFDSNFSLVAHSVPASLSLPEAQHVVSNHYANVDVLQKLADDGVMDMLQHNSRPTLIKLPNGYEKLVMNIFDNHECVGMIGFYSYIRPFEISDYSMVSFVAKVVGSYFHRNGYSSSTWTPYDYIFNYLLTNDGVPSSKVINDLGVSFPPQMRLMSISFSNPAQMQDVPLKFIESSITKMLPKSRSYFYAQSVLVLCKAQLFEAEANESFFTQLDAFLSKYHLFAGISNSFSKLGDFHKAYEEVTSAVAIGPVLPYKHPYFFYVDYTVPHMLQILNKSGDIERFYHPSFTALMEYDKKYNTQYTECLMVYLKYNGNMAECANYFSIHYNSIKYRMKVIQDVCGIDLHDINTFIHLYLSYLIYTLYGKKFEADEKAPHEEKQ